MYRLRVTLEGGRDVTIPDPITLDTTPPAAVIGRVHIGSSTVAVHYTHSKGNVHAELDVYQRGRLVVHKRRVIPRVAHFQLDDAAPGPATIEIVAIDQAGNRTPDPPRVAVTLP
jgi:hypothetical protein